MATTTIAPRGFGAAPATFVGLMVLTALAWSVAETGDRPGAPGRESHAAQAVVMTIAAVKLHLVGMHFMELRHAPLVLRVLFDAWIVIVCGLVVGLQVLSA